MPFENSIAAAGWFSSPASNLDGVGNFHMANNTDTDVFRKKDNPADAGSIAARLSSGNVTA